MKIKEGFVLRKIADTYVVVAVGNAAKEFKGMVTLNETGGFLWEKLSAGLDRNSLVKAMTEEYEVDENTASSDVDKFIKNVSDAGFIEE